MTTEELTRSALVVAPHPDDESLGCGGTIARKRACGAPVTIAILTDGSHSHDRYAGVDEMRERRSGEAIDAAAALGVDARNLVQFGIEDTRLTEYETAATARLTELLQDARPAEVFVTSRYDMPPDHRAAARATFAAVRACGRPTIVREYPVWLWQHFPWSDSDHFVGKSRLIRGVASVRANRRLLRGYRTYCEIGDVLDRKREALAAHASQTRGLAGRSPWPTLTDVSRGEFVACFDRDAEFFQTTEVDGDD
jgi:LmbE family N-acetylglucosaminyl deacetylase